MPVVKNIFLAWLLSVSCVSAFPSFDPFTSATASGGTSYAAGSPLYYQANALGEGWSVWSGGSSTSTVTCLNTTLNYGGFPAGFPGAALARAVMLPGVTPGVTGYGAALQLSRAISADPNGLVTNKIYASFLLQITNLGNLSSGSPIYFGGFATNSGNQSVSLPSRAMKLFLKGNSGTVGASTAYSLGIQNANGAGTAAVYDAGGHGTGDVLFVVIDYEFGINGAADVANLWVNPAAGSFGAATPPAATASFSAATSASQLISAADFYLLARSGATLWGALAVGNLRVADSWSYVTGAPEIITPLTNQTNNAGSTALLAINAVAAATNASPLTYQWQFNATNLVDGGNIAGSATASLSISNLTALNAGIYTVIVSNSLAALTNSATLFINGVAISSNPLSQTILPGGTGSFTVGTPNGNISYFQWQENGVNLSNGDSASGTIFFGAQSSTLVLSNVSYGDNGAVFSCAVSNSAGLSATSAGAILTVSDPFFISDPQSVTTNYGANASFSVVAMGSSPLTYQWQNDGVNVTNGLSRSGALVSGATSTNLTITGLGYSEAGNYSVTIYNSHGESLASPAAELNVLDTNLANSIDYLNVKAYGAKGDGVTDDTAAFVAAINAAQTQNHGGIYLPLAKYVITSPLTLNAVEMLGRFAGGWPADNVPLPTLLIRQYTAPGLALVSGASLHGLAINYDQATPATSNAPAISVQGVGTTLSSLRIVNAYDAITTPQPSQPGRARYQDILINSPAHVGVQISKCYDFVQYRHIEVRCPGAMSTGPAFRFGRVDEGGYLGLMASNCATGLEFLEDTDTNGGYFGGGFTACSAINCGIGVNVIGDHRIKVSGCDFSTSNYGVYINGTNTQMTIVGSKFQVASNQAIQVVQAQNIIFSANIFSRPAPVSNPLAQIQNCTTVTFKDCQFMAGSSGLELDGQVQRAVIYGNSFEDGAVSNYMTTGKYVVAANLFTASPPTGLTALPGNGSVSLSWVAPLGATNYNVKRALDSGGPYPTLASVSATNYADSAVTNGVTYYYVVSAINSGSESANSVEVNATPQIPPPSAPANFTAIPASGQVAFAWTAATGATSYNLKQSLVSGGPYSILAHLPVTAYTNYAVTNGVTYYYVVSALNIGGESANSPEVSATPQSALPTVPAGFTALAANGAAVISWNPVSGATSYYLKRSLASGGPYAIIAETASTSWIDLVVTNFTTYFYVVTAVNEAGASANSAQLAVTPQAPIQLGAVVSGNQINLSWPGWATNYNVYATTNLSGLPVWQLITNLPQTNGGTINLSLPISHAGQKFYRLFGP